MPAYIVVPSYYTFCCLYAITFGCWFCKWTTFHLLSCKQMMNKLSVVWERISFLECL